jgi:hypothetical protein
MSTEITVRFYLDSDDLVAGDSLCRIVRAFSDWPQATGRYSGLKVSGGNRQNVVFRHDGDLDADGICRFAEGRHHATELLSTRSSFKCWRFVNGNPVAGSVGVWLEAWGIDWTVRNHEHRGVGGDAALSIFDCGPFCALIDTKDSHRAAVNAQIEENLDTLMSLIFRLIEVLEPRSVKVFTDLGLYLPFNAHVLYAQDESVVLDDLALIARVWEEGLPAHGIGPIRTCRSAEMDTVFHSWRSSAQRECVRAQLDRYITKYGTRSFSDVRRVLATGRFDSYTMPRGVTILEYPHFINAFVHRFYLDVLGA